MMQRDKARRATGNVREATGKSVAQALENLWKMGGYRCLGWSVGLSDLSGACLGFSSPQGDRN